MGSLSDRQTLVLQIYSIIASVGSALIIVLSLHNLVRFTREIKIVGNKALIVAFYSFSIIQSVSIILHDVFNL